MNECIEWLIDYKRSLPISNDHIDKWFPRKFVLRLIHQHYQRSSLQLNPPIYPPFAGYFFFKFLHFNFLIFLFFQNSSLSFRFRLSLILSKIWMAIVDKPIIFYFQVTLWSDFLDTAPAYSYTRNILIPVVHAISIQLVCIKRGLWIHVPEFLKIYQGKRLSARATSC